MNILPAEPLFARLDASAEAWSRLFSHIRTRYVMEEIYDGKDEVKLRQGGKTLATFIAHDGFFTLLLIFGKKEREAFEAVQDSFPSTIREFYHASKTYHDGKWMFFDVRDSSDIGSFIRLLEIKKKPNRKKEDLSDALLARCGHRCDQCLLYFQNSANGGNLRFQKIEWNCYHHDPEPRTDYSNHHCPGCREECHVAKCLAARGYENCIDCDCDHCENPEHFFIIPGNCNFGLSIEEIELGILPYCARERFRTIKAGQK